MRKGRYMRSEKGQVLVIIVLALVGLLGMAALAIDGGMIYSHRRTAQNAVDAAAYAAAADITSRVKEVDKVDWTCDQLRLPGNWKVAANEAIDRAGENKFDIDFSGATVTNDVVKKITTISYGMDDNNGVEFICSEGTNKYIDVHVRLTTTIETTLMKAVSSDSVVNTVDSVVRVRPRVLLAEGAAIVALKNVCGNISPEKYDGGITVEGSGEVTINGGGMRSNACLRFLGEGGDISIEDGGITYDTYSQDNGSQPVYPPPTTGEDIDVTDTVEILTTQLRAGCDTYESAGKITNGVYNPGKYSGVDLKNGKTVTLRPGLYCITGDFEATGGTMTGNGVTIFMDENAGVFSTVGNGSTTANIVLTAPVVGCEVETPGCKPAVGGMLIFYLGDDNKLTYNGKAPEVKIGGSASSQYEGTILVPKTQIKVGGNSEMISSIGAQIIAESVVVHGNTTLSIEYDPKFSVSFPSTMNLQK